MRKLRRCVLRLCLFVACLAPCALPNAQARTKTATARQTGTPRPTAYPAADYAADVVVLVDGKPVARGLLIGGTVYLPIRATAEALSVSVSWDSVTHVVSLSTAPVSAGPPVGATPATLTPVASAATTSPTPPRAFNADLQKRALAFLESRFPPPIPPTRPQLMSPPQPVLPPPVYIPPVPTHPTQGGYAHYQYGKDKAEYEIAVREEYARQRQAATILADYQHQCDAATADYQQALAEYEKKLREFDARVLSRSEALAAANLVAAAAGTPAESDSWQALSTALGRILVRLTLTPEESKVAGELARLAAQEALLLPSGKAAPGV